MSGQLAVSAGQYSDKGRKESNQDFHGLCIPREPQLSSKGVAIALADGISSSDVSHIASETAVKGFLADYFCTSDAWSVKKSAERVLLATNSWLTSQTRQSRYRYDMDRGYVCTFTAMVIKSTTAHIFHAGDARIYRVRDNSLEQLTEDHRFWVSQETSYLSRALGINPQLEIDYRTLAVEQGDIFFLATDGVHEFVEPRFVVDTVRQYSQDLDAAAQAIVARAFERGSTDNLTAQVVRIDDLPAPEVGEIQRQLTDLPLPPLLDARSLFDGYRIVRELHASSRSHVYLAVDEDTGAAAVIKTPSIDQQQDPLYLERLLLEEWIARRISSAHVLRPSPQTRSRNYLYTVSEFIDGQTLAQWMIDHPRPDLDTVRNIIEQIGKGLRAFHRLEILHQDLRPANIMIDSTQTVKIIDFGSARVAGIAELTADAERNHLLGTAQYTAPEYFLGEEGTTRSDIFSLGVIAYQMLTGRLPYGTDVAKIKTPSHQNNLAYRAAFHDDRRFPVWLDEVLRKAVHPNPWRRYEDVSEFIFQLRNPDPAIQHKTRQPLAQRNPVVFWKIVSLVLAVAVVVLLVR
jgi:serine/threonine protein phosphatase PrpC/predicted Ser/Thr protein kinase